MKMADSSSNGQKTLGERRNRSLRALFSFPTVFSSMPVRPPESAPAVSLDQDEVAGDITCPLL